MKHFIQYLIFALWSLGLALSISSCKDDVEYIYAGNVTVTTTSSPLRTNFLEARFVAKVNCTGKGWRASCTSDWVDLSMTQGTDGDCLYISVDKNISDEMRLAIVRFYDVADPNTVSDYVEIIQSASSHSLNALLTAQMEQKHRLGYGYNIFGGFANDSSFSNKAVFHYDYMLFMEKKGMQMITEDLRHMEELEIISANTLTELQSKLTKTEEDGSYFMGCGKTTKDEKTILKDKTSDQECGMIRLKQIVSSRTIDLGAVLAVLQTSERDSLYSPEFLKAINAIKNAGNNDAKKKALKTMYSNFGSHLVLSADLGGEIRVNTLVERITSVESTHSVKKITKKIFGKKVSDTSSTIDTYSENEKINYQIDMVLTGGSDAAQKVLLGKVVNKDISNPITDDEIIQWQNSIQFTTHLADTTKEYNAAMVDCRLIPLYEIIYDKDVANAYRDYLVSINAEQERAADEPEPAICSLENIHPATPDSEEEDLYAKCIYVDNTLRAVIGSEYIPAIRPDKPCLVAYPIVAGKPFMYSGIFVGDSEHLPGTVRWLGNNCLYEPNEIFVKDTLGLLDVDGQLKSLYLYWGAVQMVPNPQLEEEKLKHSEVSKARIKVTNQDTDPYVVKVGPHYWTRTPLELDGIAKQENLGSPYLTTGKNPAAWANTQYSWAKHLPNSSQAKSVIKFLNGRTELMENGYFNKINTYYIDDDFPVIDIPVKANMLGLNWPKGYLAVGSNGLGNLCDETSWLIPTYDGKSLSITRLSMSGNATTMDYVDYVQSVGYLSDEFEKFIPFYFCTDEVY